MNLYPTLPPPQLINKEGISKLLENFIEESSICNYFSLWNNVKDTWVHN